MDILSRCVRCHSSAEIRAKNKKKLKRRDSEMMKDDKTEGLKTVCN